MRMLLERFPTGVLLEDERNTVVAANPILCNLLTLTSQPGKLHGLSHAEFLQLLEDEHAGQLLLPEDELASGYRTELEEAIIETPEASIAVTISIGVALLYGHSIDSVQEAADKALYQAKHNGRNQVSLAQ